MRLSFFHIVGISTITLTLIQCEVDDPVLENAEELITHFRIELTPESVGDIQIFQFQDPDGEGGYIPIISSDTLDANTLYTATLTLLNEASSPIIDVGEEVQEEADEHQFFFIITDVPVEHSYADEDENGNPIGLINRFTTMTPGEGTLKVILRHEPDKYADGVSQGDITLAGGSTDLEVEFPLIVR